MRKTILFVAALAAGQLLVSQVQAKVIKISLREMLSKSDAVVIGEVLTIEETGDTKVDERGWEQRDTVALVKVERGVTGRSDTELSIHFDRNITPNPEFKIGRRSLLFLKRDETGYRVVQQYAGNIAIEKDELIDIYLMGEAERQKLGDFLKKIGELVKQ